MKIIKWLGGLIIALIVIVVLAIIILPNVIDVNDYKEEIGSLVKENTGRNLDIDGDLELSVFPWLGIKTGALSLSQPDGIDGDMMSIDSAQLRLKIVPLLSKQIEIDTIILSQPKVNLVTLKSGLDSLSGLTGDEAEEEVEEASSDSAVSLAVQGIEITDAIVIIDDRKEGSKMELSNLNLVTGNLLGSSMASIKATGQLKDSASPDITKFELDGQAKIDPDSYNVNMADLVADVIQGEQNIQLKMASLSFTDSALVELAEVVATISGPVDLKATIASLSANLDTQKASMPSLIAEVENLKAQLNDVNVSSFIDNPSLTASLLIEPFNAAQLLKKMEIDFVPADSKAMTSVGLSANLKGGLDSASIEKLNVTLDETKLTGNAAVRNFEKPKITFDLDLNEIDLDRYLPESEDVAEDEVSGGDSLAVPMELFSDIDANGSFSANKFTLAGVSLTDIDVIVKSTPGNVSITPKASLYEGKLDGAVTYKETGETSSTLNVKQEIGIVQLGQLLNDADVTDRFEGIGKLVVDLLITEVDGKQSNSGVITLSAKDGQISGVNVNKLIDQATSAYNSLKQLNGNQEPEQTEVENTPSDLTEFADLSGTFNLNDFLITNDDLKMIAPGFNLTGQGTMNVEANTIDYTVSLGISEKVSGSLAGQTIPVRCSGALDAPTCLPDMKAMYKLYLKGKVDDKKDELKDKLKNKLFGIEEAEVDANSDAVETADQGAAAENDAETEADTATTEPDAPKTKKEKKDELKKKLLKSLFD